MVKYHPVRFRTGFRAQRKGPMQLHRALFIFYMLYLPLAKGYKPTAIWSEATYRRLRFN